jgi:uncharacterized membrane protein YeiH
MATTALADGLPTYFFFQSFEEIPEAALVVVDAAGLSLLAVTGAEKALEYKLTSIAAVMMGALTGVGGSTIRDVLLGKCQRSFVSLGKRRADRGRCARRRARFSRFAGAG